MVDKEPGSYRPRRAFIEPEDTADDQQATQGDGKHDPTPTPASPPATPAAGPAPAASTPAPAAVEPPAPAPNSPAPTPTADDTVIAPVVPSSRPRQPLPWEEEDAPPPLYRSDVHTPADPPKVTAASPSEKTASPVPAAQPTTSSASSASSDTGATRMTSGASRRSPSVGGGEDSTTILPRTGSGNRIPSQDHGDLHDFIDDEPPARNKTRLALIIGITAAVVIIGLVVGYAVLGIGRNPQTNPPPSVSPPTSATESGQSGSPSGTGTQELLSDASMVAPEAAKQLDPARTWTVAETVRGLSDDSPTAACLGGTIEGLPANQQVILRTLTSGTGAEAPGALHQALAYGSVEEAAQAYSALAKAIGSCSMPGGYLYTGRTVTGLGDQSAAVTVEVLTGGTSQFRTLVLSRTGQAVNILDAVQPKKGISVTKVARALTPSITQQCTVSGGKCAETVADAAGPPPLGGDQPGLLANGDLPPVGDFTSLWAGAEPAPPSEDFSGSGCETTNWSTVEAEDRTSRVYILESGVSEFGVNQILLTMKDAKAAAALVKKIRDDLETCATRKPTATVTKPAAVAAVGAMDAEVKGFTATVDQKTSDGTAKYRVGAVAVDNKVAYTFANPVDDFNFTDAQFDRVAERAGQRASQTS